MKIEAITKYKFRGVEYNSLKEVKEAVENKIGEDVLDPIGRVCDIRHRDILKLFEVICKPEIRKVLVECLNINYEVVEDYVDEDGRYIETTETHNILDLK